MFKQHPHTPAHLFLDDTLCFITGAIYKKRKLMNTSELRFKFIETIKDCFKEHNWELQHWVVLNNHYHLMAMSGDGKLLSNIIKKIHGTSSYYIRKTVECERPVMEERDLQRNLMIIHNTRILY